MATTITYMNYSTNCMNLARALYVLLMVLTVRMLVMALNGLRCHYIPIQHLLWSALALAMLSRVHLLPALIKGNSVEGALQWGPINSMNVVQHVGAQAGLLN